MAFDLPSLVVGAAVTAAAFLFAGAAARSQAKGAGLLARRGRRSGSGSRPGAAHDDDAHDATAADDDVTTEVLFFPDSAVEPYEESAETRGANCGDILTQSPSLRRMVGHLNGAVSSIDVCLYLVSNEVLASAVLERLRRGGVRVRLLTDDQTVDFKGSLVGQFRAKGAFVRTKKSAYLMHHKFALVDGRLLITGSFNWTMQAVLGNDENVIVTAQPRLVRPFARAFESLWDSNGRRDQVT